jgi:cholesterol oxidase
MVGCRHNAKNTLPKNYLWFAEKSGARLQTEARVVDVRPLDAHEASPPGEVEGPRYEVFWKHSTNPLGRPGRAVSRNVIFAAGVLGTVGLLLRLRDVTKSLPDLSPRLGEQVRTNSESLLGSIARSGDKDWSEGVAISSIFNADAVTRVEPVRYPAGSSLMRFLGAPLISDVTSVPARILRTITWVFTRPVDFLRAIVLPGWAKRVTILLIMQNVDNALRLRTGRSWLTGFRRGLVAEQYGSGSVAARVDSGHEVTREFSRRIDGVNLGSLTENVFNLPTTAHILGGAPIGKDSSEGLVDESFRVHNYPGLFVIDGSVMPANPGVNPSLTIAALAEYAMERIPRRP